MAKIKVGIAGCLGRMGQELTKKILEDKNFIFVGGFEHKAHQKIGNKISDVTKIHDKNCAPKIIEKHVRINEFYEEKKTLCDNALVVS